MTAFPRPGPEPVAPATPPPGLRVGPYVLLTRIGEGGMGVVHLAQRPGEQRVALKVLRPHIIGDDEARARLAREVNSLSRIRSRWVAEIVDADPWGDIPYVATRYVPGLSLHDHVREEGPIRGDDLIHFATGLAEGVQAVHQHGVLHRDVKPSNVLMEGRAPILIDFGLARVADDPKLTHTGWLLGTPGYLAPEILYGEDATTASDVHAWAATVAFAAMGRPPFGTGPGMAIMDRVRRGEHRLDGLPAGVRPVVVDALHPEPHRRPTLAAIIDRLRAPAVHAAPRPPVEDDVFTTPLAIAALAHTHDVTEPAAWAEPDPGPRQATWRDDDYRDPMSVTLVQPAEHAPYDGPPGAVPHPGWLPPPKPPAAVRARRAALFAGLTLLAGSAIAAAPYVATLVLIVGAWLLRSGSLAGTAASLRRQLRGAKRWYDGPQLLLATPWHLLQSIPGTVLLVLWGFGLATAAGLLAYAFSLGQAWGLLLAGLLFAGSLGLGPGGRRVRNPLRRLVEPLSERPLPWGVALGAVVLLAVAVLNVVAQGGPSWAPAQDHLLAGFGWDSLLPAGLR